MATLLLRSAGSAVGTLLGGPIGGLIGGAAGAVGGAVVDNILANALMTRPRTPQLDTIALTSSNEGTAVKKLWGRMRLGGNVIWATQFQVTTSNDKTSSGKGFGSSNAKTTHYELSFAVAFCEGGDNVTLGRVWADGNELDLSQYGYAFHNGSESQLPDDAAPVTGLVPAFGGTPSDDTVVQAIEAMKADGLRVMFYPFILMDVPPGNGLPDPYGGREQAAFPWRGRITCYPAPGQPGSPDKTAAAAAEVEAFFAQYAPMVLHYATLCASAGGVDAFIIGSELVGLTQIRSSAGDGTYPAVAALRTLVAQVRAILGSGCRIGYAADWTEYHSHRPDDGSNDVIFNMDPLWSDPNIDFIGIDNYLPLSDWRDGEPNIDGDPVAGPFTIYDKAYLGRNVEGGEDYDWYYASLADRVAQTRTPIRDTSRGKHWVFRQKDIRNWWLNPHHSRPGGVENVSPTSFGPQAKPVWLTEFGCPAVDKGPNQPNVFYDPKSAESALPYFSLGSKDDPAQRAYLETLLAYWRDNAPVSSVYGGPMIDTADMFAWAWDARPYPNFPGLTSVWHDTPNYELGHWLTGRLEQVPLRWIIAELCAAVGLAQYESSALQSASTLVLGYATSALSSPRDILAGLMDAFQFDARESDGVVSFFAKGNVRLSAVAASRLVLDGAGDPGYALTRAADTDLPGALRLSFADPFRAYGSAAVEARKAIGNSQNVATIATAATLDGTYASDVARSLLQQLWAARETGRIKLPPSLLRLDAGDALALALDDLQMSFRIRAVETSTYRAADLVGFDPSLLKVSSPPEPQTTSPRPVTLGAPVIEFVDLPLITGNEAQPWAPRVVAYAAPWAGVDIYRGNAGGGFDHVTTLDSPSVIGELTAPLYSGPTGRWDHGNTVSVRFYGAASLLSLTEAQVLGGAGALAVKNAALGQWEVLQFQNATLTGRGSYSLTKLLRGQAGTEGEMRDPVPVGSRVVFLDASALVPLDMTLNLRGLIQTLRYGPSALPADDARYTTVSLGFDGAGLRPCSVSHIAAVRSRPSNDVAFSWVRRTRYAGDAWDPDIVPLNEQSEAYDLEVLDGSGAVVRRVGGLAQPSWTYTAADQTADFGAPQPSYRLNLYQLSALYGRGQVATGMVFP